MDKFWKEIALSVALSMVLPWLVLLVSAKVLLERRPAPPQAPIAEQTELPDHLCVEGLAQDMALEEYVLGVVMAEMPATFHAEALKAQAVVARTYALKRLRDADRAHTAPVCADPECCQAYISYAEYIERLGTPADARKIRQAVEQTAGIVLTYQGQLIEATYFSCSGGKTEAAVAVWGQQIPYLQSVDSPGEEGAEKFYESRFMAAAEFAGALGLGLSGSPKNWLGAVTYTDGGGVASMVIGGAEYTGVQLRQLLKLHSTAFSMYPEESGVRIVTLGHGHRVGMSQYGADAMARSGSSWQQILTYYYRGVVIDKGENIE